MSDWAARLFATVVTVPIAAGVMALHVLLEAWAITTLWLWFVVPTFALPPLNYPQAIGVMLIVSLLTINIDKKHEPDNPAWYGFTILIRPFITVGIGWIAKQWM